MQIRCPELAASRCVFKKTQGNSWVGLKFHCSQTEISKVDHLSSKPKPAPSFTGYSDIALFPDGSTGVLYEHGELEDADEKSERYDEIAFVRVPWDLPHSTGSAPSLKR